MTDGGSAPAATRLLFVCTANLCRSPFLEYYARHRLRPDLAASVEVASAGTHAHPGRPADEETIDALDRLDIDGRGHLSRPLDSDLLAWADLVITADAGHRGWILDEVPARFARIWTLGQLHAALERADPRTASGLDLLDAAVDVRGPTGPATDVEDPFGQGAEAVTAAAALMRRWLDPVLLALRLADERPPQI